MNYIDLVILLILIASGIYGYYRGFIRLFLSLLFFVLSIFLAFSFNDAFSSFFRASLKMPPQILRVLTFVFLWSLFELIFAIIYSLIDTKIPENVKKSPYNKFFGIFPSFFRGLFIIAVFLTLLVAFPVSERFKDEVFSSRIGHPLVSLISSAEKQVDSLFGGGVTDTFTLLTIKPETEESVELGFKTNKLQVSEDSESKMFNLVNKERVDRGFEPLVLDPELREVARSHSKDMFENGYFSHENLEGESPFDRMKKAGIKFLVAGENLALAQTVELAHQGLMESPGHRANILNQEFGKIGIGVIDGGIYGKMFTQNFTD